MINEFLNMNGYGQYVWPAFLFTHLSLISLYLIIKFGTLNSERVSLAKSQGMNKEILSNTSSI